MNIEPLTAFFFLEGLTFDIIGAILIVKGLYPFPYKLGDILEIGKDLDEENRLLIDVRERITKLDVNDPHYRISLGNLNRTYLEHARNIRTLTKTTPIKFRVHTLQERENYSLDKAKQGLPFLVGGFLLQGIGVILQL